KVVRCESEAAILASLATFSCGDQTYAENSNHGFIDSERPSVAVKTLDISTRTHQEILATFNPYFRRRGMAQKSEWAGSSRVGSRLKNSDQVTNFCVRQLH